MIEQSVFQPKLRVFRQLDVGRLSKEFVSRLQIEEGSVEWVDANRARNLEWTEEVMSATIGAAIVDAEGNFLAKFTGKNATSKAETARANARLTFSVDVGNSTPDAGNDTSSGLPDNT